MLHVLPEYSRCMLHASSPAVAVLLQGAVQTDVSSALLLSGFINCQSSCTDGVTQVRRGCLSWCCLPISMHTSAGV
jgi:hypothetical protein